MENLITSRLIKLKKQLATCPEFGSAPACLLYLLQVGGGALFTPSITGLWKLCLLYKLLGGGGFLYYIIIGVKKTLIALSALMKGGLCLLYQY